MDDRSIVEIKDIGNKNLILFFLITYSFSWLFWLPSVLTSLLFSTQVVLYTPKKEKKSLIIKDLI